MKKHWIMGGLISLLLLGTSLHAEVLYTNDFGTSAQLAQLSWSGVGGGTSYVKTTTSGLPPVPGDLDGDGLYKRVYLGIYANEENPVVSATGTFYVYAPAFSTLTNITLSGYGQADWTTGGTRVTWALADGAYTVQDDGSNVWKQYTVTSPPEFSSSTVAVQVTLETTATSLMSSKLAFMGAITVEADIVSVAGGRVDIYRTDFGTEDQQRSWLVQGAHAFSTGIGLPVGDVDGDGQASALFYIWDDNPIHTAVTRFDAPPGKAFGNPQVTSVGFGHYGVDSWSQLLISADGVDWDVYDHPPDGISYWCSQNVDASGNPRYQGLESLYIKVLQHNGKEYVSGGTDRSAHLFSVIASGELQSLSPANNMARAIWVNDFGTVAQRTVGTEGEWDTAVTLHGTPDLTYYANGWNSTSTDWDDDGLHGGLAATGDMAVRYIKRIDAPAGMTMRNVSVKAHGHADDSADATFGVGLSLDGLTWDPCDMRMASGTAAPYPDNRVQMSIFTADPNIPLAKYNDVDHLYVMVQWDNATAVTDPELAAYLTDVIVEADLTGSGQPLNASKMGLDESNMAYDFSLAINHLELPDPGDPDNLLSDPALRQAWWNEIHTARDGGRPYLLVLTFGTATTLTDIQARLDALLDNSEVTTYYSDPVGLCFGARQQPATGLLSDTMHNQLYDYIKANWPILPVYRWYDSPIKPLSFDAGVAEKADGYVTEDFDTTDATAFRRAVMAHRITGKSLVQIVWASEPEQTGRFADDWQTGTAAENQNGLVLNAPDSALEQYWWMATDTLREFGLPVALHGQVAGSVDDWVNTENSPNHDYIKNTLVEPTRFDMQLSTGLPEPSADYALSLGMEVNTGSVYNYEDDYLTNATNIGLGTIQEASIYGFSHLTQTTDSGGVLVTQGDTPGQVELVYRFYATAGGLSNVSATLTGSAIRHSQA